MALGWVGRTGSHLAEKNRPVWTGLPLFGCGVMTRSYWESSLRKAEHRMVAEPTGEPFRWAQTVSSDPLVLLFSKSIKGKEQS